MPPFLSSPAGHSEQSLSSAEATILIVDDAVRLRDRLEDFLSSHRFETAFLPDGSDALGAIDRIKPDLVLLDVMMPGEDGFEVLRRIRNVSAIPVIMLTASNNRRDRVKGLDQGADDYIGKPFSLGELLARIKAVLRRSKPGGALEGALEPSQDGTCGLPNAPPALLSVGSFSLDISGHRIIYSDNGFRRLKTLSILEFRLFHLFMSNAGRTLTRDRILEHILDKRVHAGDHNLNVYINRLRKILAELGADPSTINTVWGQGYRWGRGSSPPAL
jgi:DNA-binding response OmpR family regulator